MKKKKVTVTIVKYQTGEKVPNNAVYINSLVEKPLNEQSFPIIWHYFLLHQSNLK